MQHSDTSIESDHVNTASVVFPSSLILSYFIYFYPLGVWDETFHSGSSTRFMSPGKYMHFAHMGEPSIRPSISQADVAHDTTGRAKISRCWLGRSQPATSSQQYTVSGFSAILCLVWFVSRAELNRRKSPVELRGLLECTENTAAVVPWCGVPIPLCSFTARQAAYHRTNDWVRLLARDNRSLHVSARARCF